LCQENLGHTHLPGAGFWNAEDDISMRIHSARGKDQSSKAEVLKTFLFAIR